MRRLLRFRLGSHTLPVEQARMAEGQNRPARGMRVCTKCAARTVCDERHVLFECAAAQPLRDKYPQLFNDQAQSVHTFVWQQDKWAVAKFLLDIVDYYDAH